MAVGKADLTPPLPVAGVALGVAEANIKYANRHDVGVVVAAPESNIAAVFTQNAFAAAPVICCRDHLSQAGARVLVVNSGNANACTGDLGMAAAKQSCTAMADLCDDLRAEQVLPFSTGVVGELLPADKLIAALPGAYEKRSENNWEAFARAIMTTDTRAKWASKQVVWQGETITITGTCKGSGMINPNMATMLAYVATDAKIEQGLLEHLCRDAAQKSFNRITIDGDTSTNDACVLIASGQVSLPVLSSEDDPFYAVLSAAIIDVHQSLAKQIVMDGEGATKFIEVQVQGGGNEQECMDVAYAIAHSPLVKTALFASDPNWGRLVVAIGYAGIENLDASKVRVWLDDVLIVENGGQAEGYEEAKGQRVFDQESIIIRVDLGRGDACEQLWTTDLSHEYIRINAEYRS